MVFWTARRWSAMPLGLAGRALHHSKDLKGTDLPRQVYTLN